MRFYVFQNSEMSCLSREKYALKLIGRSMYPIVYFSKSVNEAKLILLNISTTLCIDVEQ